MHLATGVYGTQAAQYLRYSADVDLAIPEVQITQAVQVLMQSGFGVDDRWGCPKFLK
jgi:hypothetical protein